MTDYDTSVEERIAREHIRSPCYLGIDGEGAVHFCSLTSTKLCVVDVDHVEVFDYGEQPIDGSLNNWARHVQTKRGAWQDEPTIAAGDDLLEALA